MRVSLNLIKKYVDLSDISDEKIATDLTLKTVEVEKIENTSLKYENIVVGKILEVNSHPNADTLRVCMVDIGEESPRQIVCGGSNLYVGEYVVISKPGSMVHWHGEEGLVKIKETKMRGVDSYGMICGAEEVFLDSLFPPKAEDEIVDLKGLECYPGQNISEVIGSNDIILEIDNKSLSNRPDLWGHYGIARELSVIYDRELKCVTEEVSMPPLPKYDITIEDTSKCNRYIGIVIDNVNTKESPIWLKTLLYNVGLRPINAIVDITNYAMIVTGNPTHAFDKTHVSGNKIIVRNAKKGEKLLLLDDNMVDLTSDDLVISDEEGVLALAGIRGGKKDSVLDSTTGVLVEIANFEPSTIRKTDKRFAEKTEAAIRYEKGLDTERVDSTKDLIINMFKELFPEALITSYNDIYPVKTESNYIEISKEFLDTRMGKVVSTEVITKILKGLGYEVIIDGDIYKVLVPTYRSTGDVTIKDDVMGDIVRILGFDSFEAKGINYTVNHAVLQREVLLERRIKEYLSNRCGLYEVISYPWVNVKYIDACMLDKQEMVELANPPSPEQSYLRSSLVPGMLEVIVKNLRYFDKFKVYEMGEVFTKGEYHESSIDETLPIHNNYLCGCVVDKNAKSAFLELKGVLENISSYIHMENIKLALSINKVNYLDKYACMDIVLNEEVIGSFGLLKIRVMNECKIKHVNVSIFELNVSKLIPLDARTNKYTSLSVVKTYTTESCIMVTGKVVERSSKNNKIKAEVIGVYINENTEDTNNVIASKEVYNKLSYGISNYIGEYEYITIPLSSNNYKKIIKLIETKYDNKSIQTMSNETAFVKFGFNELFNEYALSYQEVESPVLFAKNISKYIFIAAIPLVSLLIFYYFSGVIYDSKKEIGIIKSLGSTNKEIVGMYLFQNIIMSLVMAAITCALISIFIPVSNIMFYSGTKPIVTVIRYSFIPYLVTIGMTIGCVLLGTLIPMINILKMKVIDIIKKG